MILLSSLGKLLRPAPPPDPTLMKSIERVVDLVDPGLRGARAYGRKLAPAVRHALDYCAGLVEALPDPIDINHRSFAEDPLVHALFASADDIEQMLGESQAVRDYLAEPASYQADELYALLATRRQTKKVLGVAQDGDIVRAEVPMELLYFTAHTLSEPDATCAGHRRLLHAAFFDSLGKTFRTHLEGLRMERKELADRRSMAQSHLAILRGKTAGPEYAVHTRRVAEIDAILSKVVDSLMPERLLDALAEDLKAPERSLLLEPITIAVDRSGVSVDVTQKPDVPQLQLSELTSRDQRRNVVMLVRIDRSTAAKAVAAVNDRRHRFLII